MEDRWSELVDRRRTNEGRMKDRWRSRKTEEGLGQVEKGGGVRGQQVEEGVGQMKELEARCRTGYRAERQLEEGGGHLEECGAQVEEGGVKTGGGQVEGLEDSWRKVKDVEKGGEAGGQVQ